MISKILIVTSLAVFVNCSKTDPTFTFGGIDLELLSRTIDMENVCKVKPLESLINATIRVLKLESSGVGENATDYLLEIGFPSNRVLFTMYQIEKNEIMRCDSFSLVGAEKDSFFQKMMDLKPQYLNTLGMVGNFGGREHFVFKFVYHVFNQYYFYCTPELADSKHSLFLSHLQKLLFVKLKVRLSSAINL